MSENKNHQLRHNCWPDVLPSLRTDIKRNVWASRKENTNFEIVIERRDSPDVIVSRAARLWFNSVHGIVISSSVLGKDRIKTEKTGIAFKIPKDSVSVSNKAGLAHNI